MVALMKVLTTTTMAAAMLAGCAGGAWQNTQPAQQLARQAEPPGSVYTGWRVFQEKCAACHGPAANGTSAGPELLSRLRGMGPRRFVGIVLQRYDWGMPDVRASADIATREVLIDEVLRREDSVLTMPAWQDEPIVSAHIADLYAYLSARAEGTQGSGRPVPSRQ